MAIQDELIKQNTIAIKALTSALKKEGRSRGGERPKSQAEEIDDVTTAQEQLNTVTEDYSILVDRVRKDGLYTAEEMKEVLESARGIEDSLEAQRKKYEIITDLLKEDTTLTQETKQVLEEQLSNQKEIIENKRRLIALEKKRQFMEKYRLNYAKKGLEYTKKTVNFFKQMGTNLLAVVDHMGKLQEKYAAFDVSVLTFKNASEQAKSVETLGTSIKKTTGFTGDFTKRITEATWNMGELGLVAKDYERVLTGLQRQVSVFSRRTDVQQDKLVRSAVGFEKLGVSAEDTGALLEQGTKLMGLSVEDTLKLEEDLIKTAKAIGVMPSVMVKGMVTSAPRLAAFGDKMGKVFVNLQKQVKATGASMDSMIGISETFYEFGSGAEAVAQLNSVFRTNLNLADMMMQTPDQIIKTLQKEFTAAGNSIEDMQKRGQLGFFELRSAAQILHTDVDTLIKTLGPTQDISKEIDKAAATAGARDINEQLKENVTSSEQIANARERDKNLLINAILPNLIKMGRLQATNAEHAVKMAEAAGQQAGYIDLQMKRQKELFKERAAQLAYFKGVREEQVADTMGYLTPMLNMLGIGGTALVGGANLLMMRNFMRGTGGPAGTPPMGGGGPGMFGAPGARLLQAGSRAPGQALLGTGGALRTAGFRGLGGLGKAGAVGGMALGGGMMAKDMYDMAFGGPEQDQKFGENLGGIIGGVALGGLGAFFGGPLGLGLGLSAGNWLGSKVGGMFDEETTTNAIVGGAQQGVRPPTGAAPGAAPVAAAMNAQARSINQLALSIQQQGERPVHVVANFFVDGKKIPVVSEASMPMNQR